jgi:hypothetical protein
MFWRDGYTKIWIAIVVVIIIQYFQDSLSCTIHLLAGTSTRAQRGKVQQLDPDPRGWPGLLV